jgi:putative transcriptional regulator
MGMSEGVIHNQIRRFRFEAGEMTQQELAERAGCTRQTIGALEQGGYVPSLALAFRIARAFNAGVEEVFQYEEEGRGEGNPHPLDPRVRRV